MEVLIWAGAAISLVGMVGILYCAAQVAKAKKAGLDDAGLRAQLRGVVVMNLGALFVSVIGLMLVVLGVTFK
ncbi:hypothetical protein C8J30_11233 [Rhodobacter viridis]|uniref:Uncharacterized protein n=1 Tax=Rhodobacter viridis TaxID=1054202 RepID=A0A318TXX9_9RHOB|nr:hypothetical protein [Rhodobacter viridis]PYF08617.1 hypothetical protein C8J30_11233 [Rhodobacter viridis]